MTSGDHREPGFAADLTALRCFYYAALYRSFTRAAEHLATTQPSISTHIKALEKLLGRVLFTRHARGATLTDAGEALFDLVQPLVDGIDQLPGRLSERLGDGSVEEIRLAAGHELLLHLVGPALRSYRPENPNVRLVVFSSARRATQEMVANDEVDFGIASPAGLSRDLAFEHVLKDELFLICPLSHPLAEREIVSLADIAAYPVLMPDPASSTRAFMERAFAQAGLDLRIAMELERWHVIKEFVALNQGIALVPGFSVAEDSARLAVRPVSSGLPSLTYGIVTRKGRHLPAPVRNLIEAIRVRSGMLRFEAQFPFRHR